MKDTVKINCYGKEKTMTREDALKFYQGCIRSSEGSERERYVNVVVGLEDGKNVIFDDLDEQWAYDNEHPENNISEWSNYVASEVIKIAKEDSDIRSASEKLVSRLPNIFKDQIYRAIWAEHVREDIEAQLAQSSMEYYEDKYEVEFSDENMKSIVNNAAELYVYDGKYDCNLSYWDNIDNLIDECASYEASEIKSNKEDIERD